MTNPHDEKYLNHLKVVKGTSSTIEQTASEIFEDKPFAEENISLYIFFNITKYVSNFVSAFSAYFCMTYLLSLFLGYNIAVLVSISTCLLIEVGKNILFTKVYKLKKKYNETNSLFYMLVILSSISILTSSAGAFLLPNSLNDNNDNSPTPTLTKSDSFALAQLDFLNVQIASNLSNYENTAQIATPNKESGEISSRIKANLTGINRKVDSLGAIKTPIQAKADSIMNGYGAATTLLAQTQQNKGFWVKIACVVLALLFELLYIRSEIYTKYYLYRVYIDSK